MTSKLTFIPEWDGYGVTDGAVVSVKEVEGGFARRRADQVGTTSIVSVSWSLDASDFATLRAFYRTVVDEGRLPFLIDLIMDDSSRTEHTAYFVPGSFQVSGAEARVRTVTAQLSVTPLADNVSADNATIAAYVPSP